MFRKPSFHSTVIPLALAFAALVVLNLGLYLRLSSQPAKGALAFPYSADYASTDISMYMPFGGDWEIRDEMLVQLSTSGSDLGSIIPLNIPPDQPYQFETRLRYLGGTMGGGIVFNAQQTTSRQKSHMARLNVDAGKLWLIYGYFDDESNFMGQGSVELPIAPSNGDPHLLGVQVNGDTYTLLLDAQAVAPNVPLQYRGGAVGLITSASQVGFDDVHVEALTDASVAVAQTQEPAAQAAPAEQTSAPPVTASDQTLVFEDSFDDSAHSQPAWTILSGSWQFESGAFVQTQTDGFDLNAVYAQPVQLPYTLRVTLTHRTGAGGGVLFNLPQANNKNGAYMVRYVEDGTFFAWGYFDAQGAFTGQGSAPVTAPGNTPHVLEITADAHAYAIRLDSTAIAEGVPLVSTASTTFVGLTSSQSAVAFEQVEVLSGSTAAQSVTAAESTAAAENAATPADSTSSIADSIAANTASGAWALVDNQIVQSDSAAVDYVAGTGIAAGTFTVSVDILLPTDPELADAGGGLVFHMAGRDDTRSGYMVRFGGGGQEIFWGAFDQSGAFQGQGSAPLDLSAGVPHKLTLVVRADSFDIKVDDGDVVKAVPSQQQQGWIGLISFRGPVVFSNILLKLGEQ